MSQCRHYLTNSHCALCAGEQIRRYQNALRAIAHRIRESQENPIDLILAIERLTQSALNA